MKWKVLCSIFLWFSWLFNLLYSQIFKTYRDVLSSDLAIIIVSFFKAGATMTIRDYFTHVLNRKTAQG